MRSLVSKKKEQPKPGRLIGYARVSTLDQDVFMQIDALTKYGCVEIFQESVSAQAKRRPQFELMRKHIEAGDTVIVYSLSRLARDLGDLIKITKSWESENIGFVSLTEHIDTRTADGKLMFNIQGAFAQFERDKTRERTHHGMQARLARGDKLGAPLKVTPSIAKAIARDLKNMTTAQVAKKHKLSVGTIYKYCPGGRGAALMAK